jgi:hypothetical protein
VSTDLPIGAHLTTPRRGYVHHGIYAGGGRVVHYAGLGRRWRARPVEEVTLDHFAGGRPVAVQPWAAPAFTGREVVERARSRLGEDRYGLIRNNCEHFVTWAITGQARSTQVERWVPRLPRALDPLALVARAEGARAA